ncbi:MAG: PASTA domain-containing protein [bacterium]
MKIKRCSMVSDFPTIMFLFLGILIILSSCGEKQNKKFNLTLVVSDNLGKNKTDALPEDIIKICLPFEYKGNFLIPRPTLYRLGYDNSTKMSLETTITGGCAGDPNNPIYIQNQTKKYLKSVKIGKVFSQPNDSSIDLKSILDSSLEVIGTRSLIAFYSTKGINTDSYNGIKISKSIDDVPTIMAEGICENGLTSVFVFIDPPISGAEPIPPIINRVVVPKLVGEPVEKATSILQRIGLQWSITEEYSAEPKGRVIKQNPAADTQVPPGRTVILTIAKWPKVPQVVGMTLQQAQSTISANGLFNVKVKTPKAQPNWVVTRQNPKGGKTVAKESEIQLVLEKPSGTDNGSQPKEKQPQGQKEEKEVTTPSSVPSDVIPSPWNDIFTLFNKNTEDSYREIIKKLSKSEEENKEKENKIERNVYYWYYKGLAYYQLKDYNKAPECFDEAWNRIGEWGKPIDSQVGLPMNSQEAKKEARYYGAMAHYMKYRITKDSNDHMEARLRVEECHNNIEDYPNGSEERTNITNAYKELEQE